jgi:hypothetical protein
MTAVANRFQQPHIKRRMMATMNVRDIKQTMCPKRFACEYTGINTGYEFPPAKVPKTADGLSALQYFEKHFAVSGNSHE